MDRELRLVLTVNGGSFNVSIDEAETGDFVEFSGEFDRDESKMGLWMSDEIESWLSIMRDEQEARRIERRLNLYKSYMSGACYESEEERRKEVGCPRLYAQASSDYPVLDAFECLCCHGYIPECPKFKSGECWDRFDELGFKLK